GQYIFSSTNVVSGSLAGVQPSTPYQIRVAMTQTGLIANGINLVPTVAKDDSSANGTLRDSDEVLSGTNTAVVNFTTGLPGANDHSLDLGFRLPMDFGDLPDNGASTGPGSYNTYVSRAGPRHVLSGTLKLGTCVTADNDGQPNAPATGDGCDDGVQRDGTTKWTPGAVITLNITVTGGTGALGAWFDWNNDGDFLDAGEFISYTNLTPGPHLVTVTIPAGYTTGQTVYSRFRIFDQNNIPGGSLTSNLFTGLAVGGEVEDYVWQFTPTAITLRDLNGHSDDGALGMLAIAAAAIIGAAILFGLTLRRRVT
ncbi:MAG TPA: GEVED domain-containing protein, partial [Anaerolineae bacterium]|nr:GEVED domain-containing protein [Anaerolineae bacterium]